MKGKSELRRSARESPGGQDAPGGKPPRGSTEREDAMPKYEEYLALAKQHGLTAFTALQDTAFRNERIDDPEANLFVIGETSSGKTLIPTLLYEKLVLDARQAGSDCPKMLFVVPYRALAAQKKQEFDGFFSAFDLSIVQSTGEFRDRDRDIQTGNADVAVVITEKAFRFQANDDGFLGKYDLVVLDEVGLINSEDRGIFFDFLFVWGTSRHSRTGRPRLVALGTPFYDWEVYIRHYRMVRIATDGSRPVKLENNTIIYEKNQIQEVEGSCGFLRPARFVTAAYYERMKSQQDPPSSLCPEGQPPCPLIEPCRTDPSGICGKTGKPCAYPLIVSGETGSIRRYILLRICAWHLLRGHQILIFINSRAEVVKTSIFLYEKLRELPELKSIFPEPPSPEECRREILNACGLNPDDVYGILEYDGVAGLEMESYQAIKSGIAFHSAALPNEVRTYIEDRLLAGREMKIVCSTETLAFGVNSAVDVVVVAGLDKQDGGPPRMITMNEYRNYAGRAGRLHPGERQPGGTVYTMVTVKQLESWERMQKEAPPRLRSVFYSSIDEKLPFFLLNLIPGSTDAGVSFDQMLEYAGLMPRESTGGEDDLADHVREAVDFLVESELLERTASKGRGRRTQGPAYLPTGIGSSMRGYILNRSDFTALRSSVGEYVDSVYQDPDKVTFLYRLLCTKQAASALNGVFENCETKLSCDELRDYIRAKSPDPGQSPWANEADERMLYVLGAVLAWCDGESARSIYTRFGVQYALLNRLTEKLSYLVEIGMRFISEIVDRKWRELTRRLEALTGKAQAAGIDRESADEQCAKFVSDTRLLSTSLYYGINTAVHRELMEYLKPLGEEAAELAARYRSDSFDPVTAKEFRSIVHAYSFFSGKTAPMLRTMEDANNYLSRRRQQYLTIQNMHRPLLVRFFEDRFGEAFNGDLNGGKEK